MKFRYNMHTRKHPILQDYKPDCSGFSNLHFRVDGFHQNLATGEIFSDPKLIKEKNDQVERIIGRKSRTAIYLSFNSRQARVGKIEYFRIRIFYGDYR